jgi:hypothetical protein
MKSFIAAVVLLGVLILPVFAQREVDPNDLKISPVKYRNSSVVIRDFFFDRRAGVPPALTAAGYTLDRYISFGLRESGMWCFLRRNSANEELIGQLQNGVRITVRGTVRQPKAKVERGRFSNTHKFDIYLLEASEVTPGWE